MVMLQSFVTYKQRSISDVWPQIQQVETISPLELYHRLQSHKRVLVVDVRSAEEYQRDGHIAGSLLLPLFMLPRLSYKLPQDCPIVCICRSGVRSQQACQQLISRGFTNVSTLVGGMLGWQQAGLPSTVDLSVEH
jgi:rhodanese-related sulfurtransferase